MATDSSILAWEIPWTEEPDRIWSVGSQRVRHDRALDTHAHTHTLCHTTPVAKCTTKVIKIWS